MPKIEELEQTLSEAQSDLERIDILLQLSDKLKDSIFEHSLKYAEEAARLAQLLNNPLAFAQSSWRLGYAKWHLTRYAEAQSDLKQAIEIFQSLNVPTLLVGALSDLALVNWRIGALNSALDLLFEAKSISENTDGRPHAGAIHANLGLIFWNLSDYKSATAYFQKALDFHQAANKLKGVLAALGNLANIYGDTGDSEKALEYYFKSLALAQDLQLDFFEAITFNNIGETYCDLEQHLQAIPYFEKSLSIREKLGDKSGIASSLTKLGMATALLERFEEGLTLLHSALLIRREIGEKLGLADTLRCIALSCLLSARRQTNTSKGVSFPTTSRTVFSLLMSATPETNRPAEPKSDLDLAFEAFYASLKIAEELDAKDLISQLHQSLSEAWELKGDLAKSYEHFKKYHEAERQVFNEESDKKLKNLQVIHQVEQTKRDAELQKSKAEQLAELDKIKTRFFANLSHEFRTPLTLLIAPLQDQLDNPKRDILRPKAEVMLRSASRLLNLINELLDLSKLEDGKLQLRVGEGDLIFFMNGIFQSFESLAEQKGISMSFETDVSELKAYFDKEKLEKIFSNLCSNAFKFTKEGGVSVFLKARQEPRPILQIVVQDTGIGIPKDQLGNVFDRFYQVESSYARRYQGTGIGLALVKELVELHHGTIAVESDEGKGTRFTLELPTAKEAYSSHELTETDADLSAQPIGAISKSVQKITVKKVASRPVRLTDSELVLVVEDNPDVRAYILEQLSAFEVAEAENGAIGIEKAKELVPDLIISDVMMPEKTGFELCAELKANLATNHIPIVLLTAKGSLDSKVKGLDIGADDYLTKPFNARELQARVKNLIEQRKRLQTHYQSSLRQPDLPPDAAQHPFLEQAAKAVTAHLGDENYSIERFAYDLFLSRSQLHRKFVALTGASPSDFIRAVRLKHAAEALLQKEKTISQIAFEVGFGANKSYFAKCFKAQFGKLPSDFAA